MIHNSIEVIPAIIAKDFEELERKIKLVEPYVNWVQLDIMDGKLVSNETFNDPLQIHALNTKINIEVHLMTWEPEHTIDDWIKSGVKRIIFHYESTHKKAEVLDKIKAAGLEAGLALNKTSPWDFIEDYIGKLDVVLIFTGERLGFGSKTIDERMFDKVKELHKKYPNLPIQIDGGINLETAKKAVEAGANRLAVGGAIFNSKDIEQTINKFINIK